ncbi:class-II aminoacyl-tRNA synthetase family protein [Streptomyces daliensis]|uniref:Aminoacyl-transfer RNA synthetases class-II family profile domain-containing protein n=1 Tax=Streptomyces daliensis TaxID=299421 RepID=A0A8T4IHU6_9ACTN|nr:hypothetical protein [Streptomyces daliensis]
MNGANGVGGVNDAGGACGVTVEALARAGLTWHASGQAALSGPLLRLAEDCDRAFLRLAAIWGAEEERHPAALPAESAERAGYLRAFPHHAVLATGLRPDEHSLNRFVDGPGVDASGRVVGAELAPPERVLTPSACYHLYVRHQGARLERALYLTTRNTCFRNEGSYAPLRRMSSFTMREIVCVGTGRETASFLERGRAVVDRFGALVQVPLRWRRATDPVFRPGRDPRGVFQRVQPVKREALYGGDDGDGDGGLALASANRHHDHFGTAFGITRGDRPAHSACTAFGVERWLLAVVDRHGTDPASWPQLEDAAVRVRDGAWTRGGAA